MSDLVIGIGHPDRGDDAVGPLVVRLLAGRVSDGVTLRARSGDLLALLDDWAGHDRVICVDAGAPAGEPGRIYCFDPLQGPLPKGLPATSSHALGLAEVIDLARVLGALPRQLSVFAIEGACFDIGAGVTPAVAAAAGQVANRIVNELNAASAAPA